MSSSRNIGTNSAQPANCARKNEQALVRQQRTQILKNETQLEKAA
jgi:hypothetical protein